MKTVTRYVLMVRWGPTQEWEPFAGYPSEEAAADYFQIVIQRGTQYDAHRIIRIDDLPIETKAND